MAFLCLFGRRGHCLGEIVVIVLVLALSLARDRFLIVVAATIIAACPAMVDGMRLVAQPLLAIVATDPFLASTLVASRPRFFRRRRSTLVALAAHSALATSHAVALFFCCCCVLRIRNGGHGGHDCDRRDHRHRCRRIVASRAIPELASRVTRPARLALLAEVARQSFFLSSRIPPSRIPSP
jgi:hypothetical protein